MPRQDNIKARGALLAVASVLSVLAACSDDSSEPAADAGVDAAALDAARPDAASTDAAGDGAVNVCPVISAATLTPATQTVGGNVTATLVVSDADQGPMGLAFTWGSVAGGAGSAGGGQSAMVTFTCTSAGPLALHYTVSDGKCTKDGTLTATCTGPLDSGVDAGTTNDAGPVDAGPSLPQVVINEVESNGGAPGDWIELYNRGSTQVDLTGWGVKDSDDSRAFRLASGAVIAPGGYLVLEEALFGFGLGIADAARLYAADGVTLVDSYTWTAHAPSTFGRCPSGDGPFKATLSSKGTDNNCADTQDAGAPWPGPSSVVEVDTLDAFPSNLSGLAYQAGDVPANSILWAVRNDPSVLYRLQTDGTSWTSPSSGEWQGGKRVFYPSGTGNPDTEGVAVVQRSGNPSLYLCAERDNGVSASRLSVLLVDPSASGASLTAQREWDLTADLPAVGPNLGFEGITFISDAELTEQAFRESSGQPYDQARFADHGGGIFLVGVEETGNIHAYALDHGSGSFARLATFSSGLPAVMDLEYDPATNYLWAYGDDSVGNLAVLFEIEASMPSLSYGQFVKRRVFRRPSGLPDLNNEGITFAPESECNAGVRAFFWSDDSPSNGHALRRGGIPCGRVY